MAASFFDRQLAMYASYHRDARNRATHFVGIPLIIFSLLVPLCWLRFELGGVVLSAGLLVGLAVLGLWIALDRVLGLALVLFLAPAWYVADRIATDGSQATGWIVFAVTFVGGWILQLVGHVFEGKRPALVSNLFQALIAPMFLALEVLIWLGLRREEPHAEAPVRR
ncbi:MAG: DUF962 domain-containing protein [Reyranellaceae bacterium]